MQIKEATTTFQMRRKGDDLPEGEQLTDGDFPRFQLVAVADFTPPVTNPVALLRGFDVRIDRVEPGDEFDGSGRPFGHLDVRVAVEDVFDDSVTVRVTFGLRDWSGDWDDEHMAMVNFAVLAD
jgi:hypothetical protein